MLFLSKLVAVVFHMFSFRSLRQVFCKICAISFSFCLAISLSIGGTAPLVAQSDTFMEGLFLLQQGNPDEAFKIWEPVAATGDPDAQYGMALLYENGGTTFDADINKSVSLYKQAAEQGLREAQTNLGLIYAEGRGVPQDVGAAASLWQSAAQAGHDMAQFNLGLAYYAGNGVPQNLEESVGLIYAAAEQGLPEAQFAYGQFHRLGLGVEKSDAEAVYWLDRAARSGNADAPELIAEIVAKGVSIPQAPNANRRPLLPLALEDSEGANIYGTLPMIEREVEMARIRAQIEAENAAAAQTDPVSAATTIEPAPLPPLPAGATSVFDQPLVNDINQALSPIAQPQQKPLTNQSVTQQIQQPAVRPQPQVDLANLPPVTPPVMIEAGQSQGLLYAAWMGTEASVADIERLWQRTVPLQPDIFGQVQAGIEEARVGKQRAYRLMVGPFPSKSIAWQICNAVKLSNPTIFCKAKIIN